MEDAHINPPCISHMLHVPGQYLTELPAKSKWDISLLDSSSHGQRLPTGLASSQALWGVCVRQPQIPDCQEMR